MSKEITKEDLQLLYEEKCLSYPKIAKVYGVSVGTIRNKIHKFGIKPRAATPYKATISAEEVKGLYQQGMSYREIAKKLGCGVKVVRNRLQEAEITPREPAEYIRVEVDEEELRDLYDVQGLGQKEICDKLGIGKGTVYRKMKEFGIEARDPADVNRNERIELTRLQEEIIDGCLLGDGHISSRTGESYFQYVSHAPDIVNHITTFFEDVRPDSKQRGLFESSYHDKRTNEEYSHYIFHTMGSPTFTDLRAKWYPNGVKLVPHDIELTPTVCLWWHLGDGSLAGTGTSDYQEIRLCTNSFVESDIDFLVNKLVQFEAKKRPFNKETVEGQFLIVIPRRKVKQFLDFIGPCPVESLKHRWDFREYKMKQYPERQCDAVGCFNMFKPKVHNQKYCSPSCSG